MARNIEIKAKIEDTKSFIDKMKNITNKEPLILDQKDTYFNCPNGRLKLREEPPEHSELIFYQRGNDLTPKLSTYKRLQKLDPAFIELLTEAYGVKVIVKKRRYVFFIDQTRIHVDEVEQLGMFIEFEVVLKDDQTVEDGQIIAKDLLTKLDISEKSLISNSYSDLLLSQNNE
jgi:predicted adenylyl cyclase CyaB